MEKNKKERIIGLVISLIGLIFLFHFSFDYVRFITTDSTVARTIEHIIFYLNNDKWGEKLQDISYWTFWSIHWSYILFVWFYRGCIGYWAIKSVRVFYKKI